MFEKETHTSLDSTLAMTQINDLDNNTMLHDLDAFGKRLCL